MGGREARLLDLGEVVLRIAVEDQLAHFDEREVFVIPNLGDIEGVIRHFSACSSLMTWI
jgi:hypothetical protein